MSHFPKHDNTQVFFQLLINSLFASTTNAFVWFSVTFWVFIETRSVLATSYIAGIYTVANALSAFFFGSIVDHHRKKSVMLASSALSFLFYGIASATYLSQDPAIFHNPSSPILWLFVVALMLGSVMGNMRNIALSTTVTLLFEEEKRDKANGMIGTVNGISFAITSITSGLVIGFLGMQWAILIAFWLMWIVLLHLFTITIEEKKIVHSLEKPKKIDIKGSISTIYLIPGLFGLIFFTTFNNFLGGVFMGLMDAYGLSLVSVQTWGIIWWCLSVAMIAGGIIISRFWLGKSPLKTLLRINVITWTVCIFFTIQPSIVLLVIGNFVWMLLFPFAEACEQTLLQKVVPFERQGRVFGFAQSVESAASPLTTFMIGPIAQFLFIPFMTTGEWVNLIGDWFGVGEARGIALIFICAGIIGLIVTLLGFLSRSYRLLSEQYSQNSSTV